MWSIPSAQAFEAKKFDVSQFDKLFLNVEAESGSSGVRGKLFRVEFLADQALSVIVTVFDYFFAPLDQKVHPDYAEKLRTERIWREKLLGKLEENKANGWGQPKVRRLFYFQSFSYLNLCSLLQKFLSQLLLFLSSFTSYRTRFFIAKWKVLMNLFPLKKGTPPKENSRKTFSRSNYVEFQLIIEERNVDRRLSRNVRKDETLLGIISVT